MKDIALALARRQADPLARRNILREYLQCAILRSLHESGAFVHLAFVGGTALRFLFDLPRYSEDLDFSLRREEGFEPVTWLSKLKRDLSLAGFPVSISWNDRRTVQVAKIKFPELLKALGLSARREQNLLIKLEIDTRPPAGAVCLTRIVTRHLMFALRYHDLPSLMAGKIHALLRRPYPKGRDWYDLLWFRSQRPPVRPNLTLLANALAQSDGKGKSPASGYAEQLVERIESLDAVALAKDVRPFLERGTDADLLTLDNIRSALVSH